METQSTTPRDRFTQLVVLASAEIALLTAVLLLFFIYSYGQNFQLSIFALGILLAGSLMIRHSLQVAQIVLVLSIVVVQLIFLLNIRYPPDMLSLFPSEVVPAAFVVFDIFLFMHILRNSAMPGERA